LGLAKSLFSLFSPAVSPTASTALTTASALLNCNSKTLFLPWPRYKYHVVSARFKTGPTLLAGWLHALANTSTIPNSAKIHPYFRRNMISSIFSTYYYSILLQAEIMFRNNENH
jgi:hypothetical protein